MGAHTFATDVGPADSAGNIQLFFTDSGRVEGSQDYTTIFIVHGSAFTGHTFNSLLPLAAAESLRLVVINRRDYPGSTPYTDAELCSIAEGKRDFLENTGREMLHFMHWFVKKHHLPRITTSKRTGTKTGGIVLMGWSMGGMTAASTLAYPDAISDVYFKTLKPYFRTMIFHDSPNLAFGPPTHDFFQGFAAYVSSYYLHPDLNSRKPEGINFAPYTEHQSMKAWNVQEVAANFAPEEGVRVEWPAALPPMQETIRRQTHLALFDEDNACRVFPDLTIVHIFCRNTGWNCVWGYWEHDRIYRENVAMGKRFRRMYTLEMEGNHFAHMDHPREFMNVLVKSIEANVRSSRM
ncbi:hypothetical protein BDZ89DRAFT_1068057 [Hymenopellis radicata]|nr:hypothetical protein BDZ89DRAFT_1068057 [Hymenopellis radicata]